MAVATEVVARFTADVSDVQSKMAGVRGAFNAVSDAATFSSAQIRNVGQTMADVGTKMTVGITLPLAGVAAAATNAAMSFETSMTKIIGLVGIASDQVGQMGEEVLAMSGAVGKSPDELAAGLFVVTSAGLRGSEAMAVLGNSARAGAAGLGETNDIARAVAGALSAYGSEVLSASDATDAIVATARAGNFETSQFAAAIGRVLPFAQQAGASFQEMGGAVALLTRVNGDAAQSVTQIQALFRAFVVPTEEAKTALAEMGMSAQDLRDSIAAKGLPATLEMLDRALGGNREQLGRLLGSSEAASAAFQILEADAATIAETFGGVRNSAGMTAEAFGAVANTTQFQVNQAMAELKATLIDLGNQFLPIVKSVMDFAKAHLNAFNSLPGPVKTFITVMAGIVAVIGPILLVVGKLIVVFSTLLSLMLKTKAVGALRAAFIGLRGDLAASRASMKQSQTSIGMLGTTAQTARIAVVTSFKAIGAAAKGLVAGLGPIGLAMLAIGGAIEIFIGKAAGAEHHLANLRDEIDLTTGKMTEAARLFIASELRTNISPEDLAMMESYGISISGFISALEQGGPALDAYRDKIAAMQQAQSEMGGAFNTGFGNIGTVNSINTIVENLDGMIGYYQDATLAAQDAAAAQVDSAVAAGDAARGMAESYREAAQKKRAADRAMTDSQRALGAALDAGVEAVEALSQAFNKMNEAIANEASRDAAIQGIKDLNASLEENGKAIKGNSDEAMSNRAAIREAAQGWIDYAAKAKDPEQAQKRLAQGQEEIRKALKAAGIKPKDSDIFKVFKAQQTESKRTVDEFAAQRDVAAKYGNEVGMNFIDGIIAELERRKKEVEAAAAAVTSGLTTGGNAGIDAESPSRDAMKVAGNFVDGVVIGVRSGAQRVSAAGADLSRLLTRAFREAMAPAMGPLQSAFSEVFANLPSLEYARRAVKEAGWNLADARDRVADAERNVRDARNAVAEAEKAVAEARKSGDPEAIKNAEKELNRVRKEAPRNIAAAERDLARARQEVVDATKELGIAQDNLDMAKFVSLNQEAIDSLMELVTAIDAVQSALEDANKVFAEMGELLDRPFGIESDLFKMFSSDVDIEGMARNYQRLVDLITRAFAMLTNAAIVGDAAAAENVEWLNGTIGQLEALVSEGIELRRRYEENLRAIAQLEKDYQATVERINKKYDELDKAGAEHLASLEEQLKSVNEVYERENGKLLSLIQERDQALDRIGSGFRSFVNNLSMDLKRGVRGIVQQSQQIADGISVALEIPDPSRSGVSGVLKARLEEVRAFANNIRTLVSRGLDPSFVKEMVEAGVSSAGEVAAALAVSSDAEIREINGIQSQLRAVTDQFSQYVSSTWYNASIAAQQATVSWIETEKQSLETLVANAKKYLEELKELRALALEEAKKAFEAERARLEEENMMLLARMDEIATQIEALIADLYARLPPEALAAGQEAITALLEGFKEKYPEVYKELNELMDQLADSLKRTVVITVEVEMAGARVGGTGPIGGKAVAAGGGSGAAAAARSAAMGAVGTRIASVTNTATRQLGAAFATAADTSAKTIGQTVTREVTRLSNRISVAVERAVAPVAQDVATTAQAAAAAQDDSWRLIRAEGLLRDGFYDEVASAERIIAWLSENAAAAGYIPRGTMLPDFEAMVARIMEPISEYWVRNPERLPEQMSRLRTWLLNILSAVRGQATPFEDAWSALKRFFDISREQGLPGTEKSATSAQILAPVPARTVTVNVSKDAVNLSINGAGLTEEALARVVSETLERGLNDLAYEVMAL